MKQKDIALIIVIIAIAAVLSIFITRQFFVSNELKTKKAEIVEPISPDFNAPDKNVFNDQAINPTQLIKIGNNNKAQPF